MTVEVIGLNPSLSRLKTFSQYEFACTPVQQGIAQKVNMGVHDMRCPKCGKQSTEYDEDKWQCLHCGNKFIYREESDTYNTSVNVQGSTLFDIDTADPSLEIPIKEPYLDWHSLDDDAELQAAENYSLVPNSFKGSNGRIHTFGCLGLLLIYGTVSLIISSALWPPGQKNGAGADGGFQMIFLLVALGGYIINHTLKAGHKTRAKARKRYLSSLEETVGWITICPLCTEAHSKHYDSEHTSREPETGPTHCTSCGKQFMLVKGKAFKIKK